MRELVKSVVRSLPKATRMALMDKIEKDMERIMRLITELRSIYDELNDIHREIAFSLLEEEE